MLWVQGGEAVIEPLLCLCALLVAVGLFCAASLVVTGLLGWEGALTNVRGR